MDTTTRRTISVKKIETQNSSSFFLILFKSSLNNFSLLAVLATLRATRHLLSCPIVEKIVEIWYSPPLTNAPKKETTINNFIWETGLVFLLPSFPQVAGSTPTPLQILLLCTYVHTAFLPTTYFTRSSFSFSPKVPSERGGGEELGINALWSNTWNMFV